MGVEFDYFFLILHKAGKLAGYASILGLLPQPIPVFNMVEAPKTKKRARVSIVIKGGKVSQVLTANEDVEVQVVDFDEIENIPDTAINQKTLNTLLTFDAVERNDAAMDQLHDDVVDQFLVRGLGADLNS